MGRIGIKTKTEKEEEKEGEKSYPIVILGFHRGARALIDLISQRSPELLQKILVIDFNPEVLKELKGMAIAGVFGDISSIDTLEHAHVKDAKIILSTISDMLLKGTNNAKIVKACRAIAPHAAIVATADSTNHVQELKNAGATEALLPYSLMGEHLIQFLLNYNYE